MHYAYDFNYSIQLDSLPKPPLPHQPKQSFTSAAQLLTEATVFANRPLAQFVQLLVTQPLFVRMGTLTCELTEILMSFMTNTIETADRLDSIREQLCQCTQQFNVVLGRQRDCYLNVAILVLALIHTKVLGEKHAKKIDRSEIFHLLHWEIKGYHSTNVALESVQSESLSKKQLPVFFERKRSEGQKNQVNSWVSFGDIGRSMNLQRQKATRFELAMNKQNNYANLARGNVLSFKKEKGKRI